MPDELAQRLATAACLLHHEGHLTYSGHVSARVPEGLLIHTYDSDRAAVRADDLLRCTLDGEPVSASATARPPLEVFIHAEIYRARQDVQAILHTHSEPSALFTLAETAERERHVRKLWSYFLARGRAAGFF